MVGHLTRGSIEYVPHKDALGHATDWEHHATLVVTEVLKGDFKAKDTPVVIGYGLEPVVGGYTQREDGFMINLRRDRQDYPKDIIQIGDIADDWGGTLVSDAGEENVWFLRRTKEAQGKLAAGEAYGIFDPEDLRPLWLKDYLAAYLAKDPEAAMRTYQEKNPSASDYRHSPQQFLDHCEVQRILKAADTKERVQKLLPFYLSFLSKWPASFEARDGLLACGPEAGAALLAVFDDPKHKDMREDIILFWGQARYEGCVDTLIGLLKHHDQFWAKQDLQKGWQNPALASPEAKERQQFHGEVYRSVTTLRVIGDPRAREAVELTQRRWQATNLDNSEIAGECTAALKAFAEKEKMPK